MAKTSGAVAPSVRVEGGTGGELAYPLMSDGDGLGSPAYEVQLATGPGMPTRDIWLKFLALPVLLFRLGQIAPLPADPGRSLRVLLQWQEDGHPDPKSWLARISPLTDEKLPRLTEGNILCPEDREYFRPWMDSSTVSTHGQD